MSTSSSVRLFFTIVVKGRLEDVLVRCTVSLTGQASEVLATRTLTLPSAMPVIVWLISVTAGASFWLLTSKFVCILLLPVISVAEATYFPVAKPVNVWAKLG